MSAPEHSRCRRRDALAHEFGRMTNWSGRHRRRCDVARQPRDAPIEVYELRAPRNLVMTYLERLKCSWTALDRSQRSATLPPLLRRRPHCAPRSPWRSSGGPVPRSGQGEARHRVAATSTPLGRRRQRRLRPHELVAPSPSPSRPPATIDLLRGRRALRERRCGTAAARLLARPPTLFDPSSGSYPEERELHERVRLYLNVCERHMAPRAAVPQTHRRAGLRSDAGDERGDLRRGARAHLRTASSERTRQRPRALHAGRRSTRSAMTLDEAVPLLLRAIELNPDNRALARHDPDLEPLRDVDSVPRGARSHRPPKPTAASDSAGGRPDSRVQRLR